MAKAMTYDELMEYALKHYNNGGDCVYECWDQKTFDDYVKQFGPMTKSKALKMFRDDKDMFDDMLGCY